MDIVLKCSLNRHLCPQRGTVLRHHQRNFYQLTEINTDIHNGARCRAQVSAEFSGIMKKEGGGKAVRDKGWEKQTKAMWHGCDKSITLME